MTRPTGYYWLKLTENNQSRWNIVHWSNDRKLWHFAYGFSSFAGVCTHRELLAEYDAVEILRIPEPDELSCMHTAGGG